MPVFNLNNFIIFLQKNQMITNKIDLIASVFFM